MRDPLPILVRQQQLWQTRLAEYRALSARQELREAFDPIYQL